MWAERWVGWRAPGTVTAPCWALVREVYRAERGVLLPERGLFAPQDEWDRLIQEGMAEWRKVEIPEDFDVALIVIMGWHVALCAGPYLLTLPHRNLGAVLQRRSIYEHHDRTKGYYRPA